MWYTMQVGRNAGIAQLVEHVIGNDEVISPNLITSSRKPLPIGGGFLDENISGNFSNSY